MTLEEILAEGGVKGDWGRTAIGRADLQGGGGRILQSDRNFG